MAVVKLQKLLSSAKRCVFESMKWFTVSCNLYGIKCKFLYAHTSVCVGKVWREKIIPAVEINTTWMLSMLQFLPDDVPKYDT